MAFNRENKNKVLYFTYRTYLIGRRKRNMKYWLWNGGSKLGSKGDALHPARLRCALRRASPLGPHL